MGNNKADSKGQREPYNQPIKVYGVSGPESRSAWRRCEGADIGSIVALEIMRAREAAKMTKKDLARALGISQGTITRIESNAGNVTITMLGRIARALNCRLDIRIVPK